MVECLVFVAEMIAVMPDDNLIAVSMFIHPRQSGVCVWLPRVKCILLILASAHFSQVFDAVVKSVAVDVVNLQCRKTAVMPSPDCMMQENIIFTAIDG